ncbi:hypothetical protein [Rhizobium leguminosarum]
MASNYRLQASETTWAIIDKEIDTPALLDAKPLVRMEATKARHMFRILDGIDGIRTTSKWWAELATERAKMPCAVQALEFKPLRPFVSGNWT